MGSETEARGESGMEYRIVEGLDNMEPADIIRLLRTTYWAQDRPAEVIETALRNSRCFGILLPGDQTLAAFARVVSDGATMYYLADVVVAEAYRRLGGTDEITPENYRCLLDAVSWRCLSDRMYWGSPYESTPLRYTALYKGPTVSTDPGNEMSVSMAASFIAYLSDIYGFSKVSAFCFGQTDFEEAFGTDFQSAYDAWVAHLLSVVGEGA